MFSHGDLIAWQTRKQKATSTSTAQAEYVALDDATKEIMFVREMHKQIAKNVQPAIIYEDNTSAINISLGTESTCSRFLLTKYYAIRQMAQAGEVIIRKVSTVDQLADIMTKSLDRSTFERIRNFLLECPDFQSSGTS